MNTYATYSDEQLLVLVKNDNGDAFTEIYERYWKKLFFVGVNKLNSFAIVEELVQDVFCDLWERRKTLDIKESLGAYIAVALKYRIINFQAKQKRAADYAKHFLSTQSEEINSTEQWLNFEELKDRLAELVDQLPEKARLAFQLNKIQGLPHKAISSQMNISEKAVERNIARTRKTLAAALKHLFFFL